MRCSRKAKACRRCLVQIWVEHRYGMPCWWRSLLEFSAAWECSATICQFGCLRFIMFDTWELHWSIKLSLHWGNIPEQEFPSLSLIASNLPPSRNREMLEVTGRHIPTYQTVWFQSVKTQNRKFATHFTSTRRSFSNPNWKSLGVTFPDPIRIPIV